MKENKIKLIIFDCYGAVLSRGYPDTVKLLSKKYGISEKKLFEILYTKYFNQAAVKKITQHEAWQKAINELGLPLTPKKLQTLHIGLLKLNKKVLSLAIDLRKDYKTLLLSKNTRSQFNATRKKFPNVWKSFDAVINTWELGLPKASEKTIREICRRFKVKPAEILIIDDQKRNLIAAKKMGAKTIFYQNFGQFKKELNRYLK